MPQAPVLAVVVAKPCFRVGGARGCNSSGRCGIAPGEVSGHENDVAYWTENTFTRSNTRIVGGIVGGWLAERGASVMVGKAASRYLIRVT